MNAPLSRYLTRFAAEVAVVAPPPPSPVEPTVMLTVAELDDRLAGAREAARDEAEAVHAAERQALEASREAAVTEAVAAARTEWCENFAGELVGQLEAAFAALQASLAEATVKAVRPLLAAEARARTLAALETMVTRLMADAAHPAVTLRAPADLVAALRARGLPEGLALVSADTAEAVVTCGSTRIETRLAAVLADIAEA